MSPAPAIVNLFVAIHEAQEVLNFLYSPHLLMLRRFVDDGFGIWMHDRDPKLDQQRWASFKAAVNNGGLTWIFTDLSPSIDLMNMTIYIAGNKIETTLSCKPLALHVHNPSHSCHAPAVLTGLIFGEVLRICTLCSKPTYHDFK
ncbi:hypothetical protein ACHAWF_005654 [Thalassiosira exigua]